MNSIKAKINFVLLKLSVNKWDVLKELDASSLDNLSARFAWNEILSAIFASDSYLTTVVREMYADVLKREADPTGLMGHVKGYREEGGRSCLEGLLESEEYWLKAGGSSGAFLSSLWRDLAGGGEPPDGEALAAALDSGRLSRAEVARTLMSRPEVAERESAALWKPFTGDARPAPETIVAAFTRGGREEAIRTICESPEFAQWVDRNPQDARQAAEPRSDERGAGLNPYRKRPPHTYWKSGVLEPGVHTDPVIGNPLSISRSDPIATAGSCFAQHLSKALAAQGYRYLVTEHYQPRPGVADESFGVYPARFGNIYTARHLLQLFERAYGLRVPATDFWQGEEGRFIDPFRPRIQEGGFPSIESLLADRERHYRAVRQMFEQCRVFIFTLGLTETWISPADGSVYPLAPGVVASRLPDDNAYFHNHSVSEVSSDLERFLALFSEVNPDAQVILTVSPVPLIATFEDRHVLVSTIASKSILRAAADEICRRHDKVTYFPSYEIITGPQTGARYYRDDLREVTEDGVSFVMSVFGRHFLSADSAAEKDAAPPPAAEEVPLPELRREDFEKFAHFASVICDEEAILR